MAVKVKVSEVIERPPDVVFKFYAEDHVRNHPRWDPNIELSRDPGEPMGVGTIIQRRNKRSGTPVDGTMEVTDYDPNGTFAVLIRDGPLEIQGRATFEPNGDDGTTLTVMADAAELDGAMQGPMTEGMQQSVRTIKELIEKET